MSTTADVEDAPLYVRWQPVNLTFAIEMRLDVIGRIRTQILAAQNTGVEVGGVFLGRAPTPSQPVLRIDDIAPVVRHPEDGPIFMLDPREHDRFLTTRWDAKAQGRSAVGFFRTHVRPGAFRLSLADRTLVTGHFTREAMTVMLVDAKSPFRAALFAGSGNRLPPEPSIPEFYVDTAAFESLPEVQGERRKAKRSLFRTLLFLLLCAVVVLGVAGTVYRVANHFASPNSGAQGQGLQLRVSGASTLVIEWNGNAADIVRAASGKLTLVDGTLHRDITLTPDVLRLGVVEYEPRNHAVSVTLTLSRPDSSSVMQSADWHSGTGS